MATCPACGHRVVFLQQPLFIITGASGAGKSSLVPELLRLTDDYVVLESDILWENRYNTPETNYQEYRELWLRMAKNIGQSGKPVVLCGTAMPDQIECCQERRYFSEVFYAALVCDGCVLADRLERRPSWRQSRSEDFIRQMLAYNRWLTLNGRNHQPAIHVLDTTNDEPKHTVVQVVEWLMSQIESEGD